MITERPSSVSPPPTPAKKARVDLPSPDPPTAINPSEMASQAQPAESSATNHLSNKSRTIDEHTDMTTLTDQEIMRLMEGMNDTEDVMTRVCPMCPHSLRIPSPSSVQLRTDGKVAVDQCTRPARGDQGGVQARLGAGAEEAGVVGAERVGSGVASKRGWGLLLPL